MQYEHVTRTQDPVAAKPKVRDANDRQLDEMQQRIEEQDRIIRRLQKDIARLNESINILSRRNER